jgi:hypothetical protein
MKENYIIIPVDPQTFEYQEYSQEDQSLISEQVIDTSFSQSTDYIEYYVYTPEQTQLFPESNTVELDNYSVREGDVVLDPAENLFDLGFVEGEYVILYEFFRRRLGSSSTRQYFINAISSDRTELELRSNAIDSQTVLDSFREFEEYREASETFVDFYLNFGNNQTVIANNMRLEAEEGDEVIVYIKLYEALPATFSLKDTLWVTEEISTPQAYSVEFPLEEVVVDDDAEYLQGPNFNIEVTQQVGKASDSFNYNQITSTPLTSSLQQLQSLLEEKGIQINVNYERRNEFIKFSSAKSRLENFYYKASLIEQTQNTLSSSIYNITGSTTGSTSFSSSKASLESIIDSTIENFDGYEYWLYYNSSSQYSWPKSSSTLPYILYPTGSSEVLQWYGSDVDDNLYYGGQILSASQYDQDNPEWLYRTIPEYLVEDPENQQYEIFLDMIGQHFDNIWLYTKDVTNRFNADNRLDYGISKDLVADAIRDFGIKLYSANYDQNDLFEAFLGIRADGDSFLVNNITGSLPVPTGSGLEYVTSQITASDQPVPLNDVQKSIYKRIYHNLPYLLKTKGTLQGIRTLISSFGIPDTILEAKEYGGSVRPWNNTLNQYQETDNLYNYALNFTGLQSVDTGWELHPSWSAVDNRPSTVIFRVQPEVVYTSSTGPTNAIQKLFSLDTGVTLELEYTGSAGVSGSYSGSVVDPEYQFAQLNLYPEGTGAGQPSASVYLPFFNGDWWNIMINYVTQSGYILRAQNRYFEDTATPDISYNGVDSVQLTGSSTWISASSANFGSPLGTALFFSGAMQEVRYYTSQIQESVFSDYTMNPESYAGSGLNLSPDELAFRATLGGELYTGSQSVHPKISGSWQV